MGLVTDIMQELDRTVESVGGRYFEATAAALGPTLTILATLLLIALGFYMVLGASLNLKDVVMLAFRVGLVFMLTSTWSNFNAFYIALTEAGNSLGARFFAIVGTGSMPGTTTYAAMDGFAQNMGDTTDGVLKAVGSIARGFLGAILYVFLAFLMAAYVLIVGYAKIMVAFLLGVAPLAFACLMFDKTKSYFEAWLNSFIGYLLYPIAASAIIATVVTVAGEQVVPQHEGNTVDAILGFFVVCIVGIAALVSIPTGVQNLTGRINLADFSPRAMGLARNAAQFGGQFGASRMGWAGLAHPRQYLGGATGGSMTEATSKDPQLRSAHEAGRTHQLKLSGVISKKLSAMSAARKS